MEDLHETWPHRWITPKAESKESRMHGFGVFAKELIKKSENVGVFGGLVVPTNQVREYWEKVAHIGIQISDDFFIVPSTREEVEKGGVFNHACEPNCGFINTFTLIAIKEIEAGEELVFDYAFCETFMDNFECSCGSSDCRKTITGNDWKIKEIQDKYKKFFSPYLQDKI
jgi:uncharacterized protein